MKTKIPHEILKKELKRKQKAQPAYSMRALARDLGVSSSYLSAVMNGKKQIPIDRLKTIAKRLEMDELTINTLKNTIALQRVPEAERSALMEAKSEPNMLQWLSNVQMASKTELKLWSKWYYIAILDLATCENFISEVDWIAKRLRVSMEEVKEAVDFLLKHQYLQEREGRWHKREAHIRLPCTTSNEVVREFHKQFLLKAISVMQAQTNPEAYAKRLISGVVVASNPQKIEKAKRHLERAMIEVSQILLEGECTELYQVGVQLFPLTQS